MDFFFVTESIHAIGSAATVPVAELISIAETGTLSVCRG